MNYAHLWNAISPKVAAESLQKYGHILKWRNNKAHIIDVGCGEGTVTSKVLYPYVKDCIKKITAVDISQQLINYAKEHNGVRNIEYQVMDAMDVEQVEKNNGTFDHVFSFYVGQWIDDQRAFAGYLRKMLKPGGQVFVAHVTGTPVHDSFHRLYRGESWSKYMPQGGGLHNYTENPTGYIGMIMEDVGFKVEVCEHDVATENIEHFPGFVRAVLSLNKYLHQIPVELQEDYYQYHLKYCIERSTYLKEPNIYSCLYETLTCIASK